MVSWARQLTAEPTPKRSVLCFFKVMAVKLRTMR